MPAAAVTVTVVLAVWPAVAVSVPLAGGTVSPAEPDGAVAPQFPVAAEVPSVLSAVTVTVVLAPGARRTWPGLRLTEARVLGGNRTWPSPKDGGASLAAVPHVVSGAVPRVKSSLRVVARST